MTPETTMFQLELVDKTLVLVPRQDLSELQFLHFDSASQQVLQELESSNARHLVVDLENTNYYGSTALGFFVKLWKRVRCNNGNMAFCHVSENEREILKVTHLDGLWQVCANRAEAIAYVENTPLQ